MDRRVFVLIGNNSWLISSTRIQTRMHSRRHIAIPHMEAAQ